MIEGNFGESLNKIIMNSEEIGTYIAEEDKKILDKELRYFFNYWQARKRKLDRQSRTGDAEHMERKIIKFMRNLNEALYNTDLDLYIFSDKDNLVGSLKKLKSNGIEEIDKKIILYNIYKKIGLTREELEIYINSKLHNILVLHDTDTDENKKIAETTWKKKIGMALDRQALYRVYGHK